MQTSTSGLEKEGESSSPMPLAKFYLDGDSCSFCRRSKVRTAEVNLHHFSKELLKCYFLNYLKLVLFRATESVCLKLFGSI